MQIYLIRLPIAMTTTTIARTAAAMNLMQVAKDLYKQTSNRSGSTRITPIATNDEFELFRTLIEQLSRSILPSTVDTNQQEQQQQQQQEPSQHVPVAAAAATVVLKEEVDPASWVALLYEKRETLYKTLTTVQKWLRVQKRHEQQQHQHQQQQFVTTATARMTRSKTISNNDNTRGDAGSIVRYNKDASTTATTWDHLLQQCHSMETYLKKLSMADGGRRRNLNGAIVTAAAAAVFGDQDTYELSTHGTGLPRLVEEYRQRLLRQKKEMYKNPPAMPPPHVRIESTWMVGLPERNRKTGALMFMAGAESDPALSKLLQQFRPNLTPAEILQGGAFGGTYFRPIVSAVTNQRYNSTAVLAETCLPEWIAGLDIATMLTSTVYRPQVNKYKVSCGGSLGMWESSGWISDADPYGWFQFYCRFYQGRRSSDDVRQIQRYLGVAGPTGRFRSQLCNKIVAARAAANDTRISPVIRQTLYHWGLEITEDIVQEHCERKNQARIR